MPYMYFPRKFVEKCEEYVEEHPEVASDVREFLVRCARLGFHILRRIYPEEVLRDCAVGGGVPGDAKIRVENDRVRIYFPDRDFEVIRRVIVEKLGLVSTAPAWVSLCALMVLLGYWELPIKL